MTPDNTYIIPSEDGDLLYAPLSRFVCRISDNSAKVTIPPQVVKINEANSDYSFLWGHVIIIPTQVCNLACTYCFARPAHSKQIISKETLQVVYDFVLSQGQEKHKSVSFIGGGEPLVVWDIVKWSIEYIEKHKTPSDILDVFLTTNGTLLNSERIDFLLQHKVHIEVSFDIIKHLQDSQRPFLSDKQSSYESVMRQIHLLEEKGASYRVRTTITPQSVQLMPEMVKQLIWFKGVRTIQLEPVTQENAHHIDFYKQYTDFFWTARDVGRRNNVNVSNSIVASVKTIRDQFCTGEFCITPDGTIVACHRNSSQRDPLFSSSTVGKVTNEVAIQHQQFDAFRMRTSLPSRCECCFARWHCAGFCPLEWDNVTEIDIQNKCSFIQENIKRALQEIVDGGQKLI